MRATERMKILDIHNQGRWPGGAERTISLTVDLLRRHGVDVVTDTRRSSELTGLIGKVRAFTSGLYSFKAYHTILQTIERERPDVVHAHRLYPLLSPSVLVACRRIGVPVVLTCHDGQLVCPTYYSTKGLCDRCMQGREYWCVLKNCRGNIFESIAYALRHAIAHWLRLFKDNVAFFICWTESFKRRLLCGGFANERIVVVPHPVEVPDVPVDPSKGSYVAYAGRLAAEKGVDVLLAAAKTQPHMPVCFAHDSSPARDLMQKAPKNAKFLGWLGRTDLSAFYCRARFVVIPSRCYDMCPNVALEAMAHGLPVIASRIGGLPEIVEDGVTGLLVEPGNSEELADKMKLLWKNPDLCRRMGQAGREKAIREYNEDVYYRRLMTVYESAIELNKEMHAQG